MTDINDIEINIGKGREPIPLVVLVAFGLLIIGLIQWIMAPTQQDICNGDPSCERTLYGPQEAPGHPLYK